MQELAVLEGTGWFRVRGTGSVAARYSIRVRRRITGPRAGDIVAGGTMQADLAVVLQAVAAGEAVLVLSGGEAVAIEITEPGAIVSAFRIVGRVPGF